MQKQINDLIQLAKEYYQIGKALNLPMTHNHIRNEGNNYQNLKCYKAGKTIVIYLADEGKTWQVEFNKVKIIGYSSRVELPFGCTAKDLTETYQDAKDHLENYLKPHLEEFKLDLTAQKLEEIKQLEEKLEKLKSQL